MTSANTFNDKLQRRNQLSYQRVSKTRGDLRYMLARSRSHLNDIVKVFRCVLHRMCVLTHADYMNDRDAWVHRWKAVSEAGFDVRNERIVDYGNWEYTAIVQFLYLQDPKCKELIDYLATYWPSLHPLDHLHSSPHGVIMKGDIVEICLAALRGHRDFDLIVAMAGLTHPCFLPRPVLYNQVQTCA